MTTRQLSMAAPTWRHLQERFEVIRQLVTEETSGGVEWTYRPISIRQLSWRLLWQLRVGPVWFLDNRVFDTPPRLKQDHMCVNSNFPDMIMSHRYRNRWYKDEFQLTFGYHVSQPPHAHCNVPIPHRRFWIFSHFDTHLIIFKDMNRWDLRMLQFC